MRSKRCLLPQTVAVNSDRGTGSLLFLYNTGARVDEAAQLTISDLRLHGCTRKIPVVRATARKGEQDSLVSAVGVNYRRA